MTSSHSEGRGEVLGDLEAFTGEVCPSSVHAVRDTEVVNIPIDFVFGLFEEHPASVLPFMYEKNQKGNPPAENLLEVTDGLLRPSR